MQERLEALNARRHVEAKPPIKMGIGVATGAVVAGNVGSAARMEYTVIGNTVNLAARLQALSLDGHILMDRRTARAIEGIPMRSLGPKLLKGIDEPVEVFEIDASGEGFAPPLVKADGSASGAVPPIGSAGRRRPRDSGRA
jgi:class 3 adenylate cyclase